MRMIDLRFGGFSHSPADSDSQILNTQFLHWPFRIPNKSDFNIFDIYCLPWQENSVSNVKSPVVCADAKKDLTSAVAKSDLLTSLEVYTVF